MIFSKLHRVYVKCISNIIWLLEIFLFYPKLKKYYLELIKHNPTFLKTDGGVILDIGANKGQSVLFFKSIFPNSEIHAFEPSPSTLSELNKTIAKRKILKTFTYGYGISDCKSTLPFYESKLNETSSFNVPNENSKYLKRKNLILLTSRKNTLNPKMIKVEKLDEFINISRIAYVTVLKIDVEGHERQVFDGATQFLKQNKALVIQFERHADDMRSDHSEYISKLLVNAGYKHSKSIKHPFGEFYEELWINSNCIVE